VRFLSAWTEVGTPTLFLALVSPAVLFGAAFLPGRRVARVTALALALAVTALGGVGLTGALRGGWSLLWVLVAWRVGRQRLQQTGDPAPRPGGVESGLIGLLLALALIVLLISAVARHDLGPRETRCASFALLLVVVGLLHLMLRRDARRALLAFAALGLGLQVLQSLARDTLLTGTADHPAAILGATALALAITDKVVRMREVSAGSPWVSDAHDLHD
jgi:hypothetical protein